MQIKLLYKTVFGRDSYYPDDDTSRIICRLIGCKCFAPWQVDIMRKEGWELDIKGAIPGF